MAAGPGIAPSVYKAAKDGAAGKVAAYAAKHFGLQFTDNPSPTAAALSVELAAARDAGDDAAAERIAVEMGTENAAVMITAMRVSVNAQREAAKAAEMAALAEAPPAAPAPPLVAPMVPPLPAAAMPAPAPGLINAAPPPAPQAAAPTPSPATPQAAASIAPGAQADAEAAVRQAAAAPRPAAPDKPLDPYTARGFTPGNLAARARFFDENGNPLMSDSHPVLSEAEAFAEQNNFSYNADQADPFLQGAFGAPGRLPSARMPHGPQRGPRRFRHQQGVIFLINGRNSMAYRPTELLMKREDLQPWFTEQLPAGVYFGG